MRIDVELSDWLRPLWDADAVREVSQMVLDDLHSWYAQLPEDWFDNPNPFPDGTPRHAGKRTFMAPLSREWQAAASEDGFKLYFENPRDGGSAWGLRLQQYGGVITPVNKRALTLPLTAEAKGKSAHAFEQSTGQNLFVVKGEAAKRNPDAIGTLVWEDPAGDLHAAYALRKRSEVPSLRSRRGHDAIPSNEKIEEWTVNAFNLYLSYKMK